MTEQNLRPARVHPSHETHPTRESESRTFTYHPPSTLPDVIESHDTVFRWVSVKVLGEADQNTLKRFADGWVPVPFEDRHKVLKNPAAFQSLAANNGGNIVVGGLMLCQQAREMNDARRQYYDKLTSDQMTGVTERLRENSDNRYSRLSQEVSTGVNGGREVQFGS